MEPVAGIAQRLGEMDLEESANMGLDECGQSEAHSLNANELIESGEIAGAREFIEMALQIAYEIPDEEVKVQRFLEISQQFICIDSKNRALEVVGDALEIVRHFSNDSDRSEGFCLISWQLVEMGEPASALDIVNEIPDPLLRQEALVKIQERA